MFGILGMEIYFPSQYISQEDLEVVDGCVGKYTKGLEQKRMALCYDDEDINSFALSVVSSLLHKYQVDPKDIGRLEVGSESNLDMSKSTKTVLMSLFKESANFDIEGVDTLNGCYGATSALFNAIHWLESSFWDGRKAVVVATDCAVYSSGPARATGGCGAIAILLGPNAPIQLIPPRGSFMDHVYDFYKPALRDTSYPIVDGQFSVSCYMKALHHCYNSFTAKFNAKNPQNPFSLENIDFIAFHSPFSKIVRKAFARLMVYDARYNNDLGRTCSPLQCVLLQDFAMPDEEFYTRFSTESNLILLTKDLFKAKTKSSTFLPQELGNLYTGSVYSSLLSILLQIPASDSSSKETSILIFSYGSGCASSMYVAKVAKTLPKQLDFVDMKKRLEQRSKIPVEHFNQILEQIETQHKAKSFTPVGHYDKDGKPLPRDPKTFFLSHIDEQYKRVYSRPSPTKSL